VVLGNTVGRDNYKFFVGLIAIHMVCGALWEITAVMYCFRRAVSWSFVVFMLYAAAMMLALCGLFFSHFNLIRFNYTTNELINKHRYMYLQNVHGYFDNPFTKTSLVANLLEVFFPDKNIYYSREEVLHGRFGGKHNDPKEAFLV
jgi:hypothetical protein